MERTPHRDKQQEGTAKPTGKAGKAGPRPWEMGPYIYNEPIDDSRSSHCDPRLELAQQSHGQHQDSELIPSDGDPEYIHPAFGIGATPDLNASSSTASDQGTLAGFRYHSAPQYASDDRTAYWKAHTEGKPVSVDQGRALYRRYLNKPSNTHPWP
jgi:hypothetical protein